MKKETITAVSFGIILGVIVALFVIFQSKEKQLSKAKPINNQTTTMTPKIKTNNIPFIEVTSPSDKVVVGSNSVVLKGKANKNSLIVIQSPIKELVFKNTKEEFSQEFPLALGENAIELTNYPADNTSSAVHKELRIYYLEIND